MLSKKALKPVIKREFVSYLTAQFAMRAQEITERWLAEYNSERPHESLSNLTPEKYPLMAEKPEVSKSTWN